MTKIYQSSKSFVGPGRHGSSGSSKYKSSVHEDKESIPTGSVTAAIRLREPYPSILMELYPGLSLSLAIKQFLIDNIKTEEL